MFTNIHTIINVLGYFPSTDLDLCTSNRSTCCNLAYRCSTLHNSPLQNRCSSPSVGAVLRLTAHTCVIPCIGASAWERLVGDNFGAFTSYSRTSRPSRRADSGKTPSSSSRYSPRPSTHSRPKSARTANLKTTLTKDELLMVRATLGGRLEVCWCWIFFVQLPS